jgi:hypothetical protein
MVSVSGAPISLKKPAVPSLVNVICLPSGIISGALREMSFVRAIMVGSVAVFTALPKEVSF